MKYRRANVPEACYFFAVNLAERNKSLLVEQVDELRLAFKKTRQDHAFDIVAIVVLPDHLHTLWQLPNHDANYSMRWNLIKRRFSGHYQKLNEYLLADNAVGWGEVRTPTSS